MRPSRGEPRGWLAMASVRPSTWSRIRPSPGRRLPTLARHAPAWAAHGSGDRRARCCLQLRDDMAREVGRIVANAKERVRTVTVKEGQAKEVKPVDPRDVSLVDGVAALVEDRERGPTSTFRPPRASKPLRSNSLTCQE